MGLGKTRASCAAVLVTNSLPCLVLCQSGLRLSWKEEILKLDPDLNVLVPDSPTPLPPSFDFVIISFSNLKEWAPELLNGIFRFLIIDEAHSFKNERELSKNKSTILRHNLINRVDITAHRTEIIFEIAREIPRVTLLTGTPILNRPKDLFNLLSLTNHRLAKNYTKFTKKYCDGHLGRHGWNAEGASNLTDLRQKIHNHVLRRTKSMALLLPKKEIKVQYITPTQSFLNSYRIAFSDYIEHLTATGQMTRTQKMFVSQRLMKFNLLRKITSCAKVPFVAEAVSRHRGKSIVFTAFHETSRLLKLAIEKRGLRVLVFSGRLNEKEKDEIIRKFQTDPQFDVLISNIEAGKTGITVTSANLCVFCDLTFSPSSHLQAEDRIYRIGQDKPVTVIYFAMNVPVEMRTMQNLSQKRRVILEMFSDDSMTRSVDVESSFLPELEQEILQSVRDGQSSLYAPVTA